MPSDRTPLLAGSRQSLDSAHSDEAAQREDDALHNSNGSLSSAAWSGRLREILLFLWALLATAAVIVLAVWVQHNRQTDHWEEPSGKRNLVFMVSDGMGPASLSLTRSYRQLVDDLPIHDTLTLDRHFWGTSRTRSSNSLVTDSAAGATAFSCGEKSYNGAIATLPDFSPCGTVLEAAKRAGYMTGLVVTTDITDATPACFASHVNMRVEEDEIALQEIGEGPLGRVVDLMFGGGRCHFLPNGTEGSCRLDDVDVAKIAQDKHGWTYLDDRPGFDSLWEGRNVSLPVLGLFAPTDIPFEIDRRDMSDIYPSLSEMAGAALRALEEATRDSDKGFFLMIEGSRIDHAGHINDPAAQVREVLEYDAAFKAVVDFIDDRKASAQGRTETVLVATSDHETGGLATALQEPGHLPLYNWYPATLARANASVERLAALLDEHMEKTADIGGGDGDDGAAEPSAQKKEALKDWINTRLVIDLLGITDARDEELDRLAAYPEMALVYFADMVSLRAHVGWSTHGHSAVDVNIYSSGGSGTERLRGNVENTDVGRFLREFLRVDVDEITKELKEKRADRGKGKREREGEETGRDEAMGGVEGLAGVEMEGLPERWYTT